MNILKRHRVSSLTKREEILKLFNKGMRLNSKFGPVYLLNEKQDNSLKVAILIKKNCGKAVNRNYIKRVIRHFIRDHITLFNNQNKVIFLYKYRDYINYNELIDEYLSVLKKI